VIRIVTIRQRLCRALSIGRAGRQYDEVAEPEPVSVDTTSSMVASSAGTVSLGYDGDVAVLRVSGALDLALAPKLAQLMDRALRREPALVVVDLTEVDFLASAGMAMLLRAHRGCPPARLHVVADSPITMRPLEMTRLTDELVVYSTLAAALARR
jgi:anti-anti-sigma factor